jgi:hypothetical protein
VEREKALRKKDRRGSAVEPWRPMGFLEATLLASGRRGEDIAAFEARDFMRLGGIACARPYAITELFA